MTPNSTCPRCHRGGVMIDTRHPVCKRCSTTLAREARAAQERDHLARWLSSRATASGDPLDASALTAHTYQRRAVRRAVAQARFLGLDWCNPPAPMHYDRRLAPLLASWRTAVA